MKLLRAVMIETGTTLCNPEWGLYNGVFCWITGRPVSAISGSSSPMTNGGSGDLIGRYESLIFTDIGDFGHLIGETVFIETLPAGGPTVSFTVYEDATKAQPVMEGVSSSNEAEEIILHPPFSGAAHGKVQQISGDTDGPVTGTALVVFAAPLVNPPENPETEGPQLTWKAGILAAEAFDGPELSVKLGIGGYSTDASLVVNIAKPGLREFLADNGIRLKNQLVRHYMVRDGEFIQFRGMLAIDDTVFGESGDSLSCVDIFRSIHKRVARDVVTAEEFPESSEQQRGKMIPASFGFVNNARNIRVTNNTGLQVVFKQGNIERTATGAAGGGQNFMPASGNSSLSISPGDPFIVLLVGDDFDFETVSTWVGRVLTAYNQEESQSRVITGVIPIEQFFLTDVGYVPALAVRYNYPFGFQIRRWNAQTATDDTLYSGVGPHPEGEHGESTTFEVLGVGNVWVGSDRPAGSFVGKPRELIEGNLQRVASSEFQFYPQLPGLNRAGAEFLSGASLRSNLGVTDYVVRNFRPASVRYMGPSFFWRDGSSFIAFGDSLPKLRDLVLINSDANGYTYTQPDFPVSTSWQRIGAWLLAQVEIPEGFELAANEDVWVGVTCFIQSQNPTNRIRNAKLTIRVCNIDDVKKDFLRPVFPDNAYLYETGIVNRPVNANESLFPETNNFTSASSRTLPDQYFTQSDGYNFRASSYNYEGTVFRERNAENVLRVTDAFSENKTRSVLVEIQISQEMRIHNDVVPFQTFRITQLGFVVTRKTSAILDNVFQDTIGNRYGSAWGVRRPDSSPVIGIPDIAEHMIRSVDERPELVDTDSFDVLASFRPPLATNGVGGWFAGRQFLEPMNTADVLDEIGKNAMTLFAPGWNGKRRAVAWFDQLGQDAPLLDESLFVEKTVRESRDSQSIDTYNEFDLRFDFNPATGKYNGRLAILNTHEDAFPDISGPWQEWTIGFSDYFTARLYWNNAHEGYLVSRIKNKLDLNLPFIPDQYEGNFVANFLTTSWRSAINSAFGMNTFPNIPTYLMLADRIISWSARPKRVSTGALIITDETLALKTGDMVLFRHPVITGGLRYYGWITHIGTGTDHLPVEVVWWPYSSPDTPQHLLYNDGASEGGVLYDDGEGEGRILINP
jgi:hypothetical protein